MSNNRTFFFLVIAALLVLVTVQGALAAQVSYWNMNDTTDVWGVHDATNSGAVGISDYPFFNVSGNSSPYASDFESGDPDYWEVADNDDFSFTDGAGNDQPFSISLWVKPESLTSSSAPIAKWDSTGREYYIIFENAGQITVDLLDAEVDKVGRNTATGVVQVGVWNHVVLTYDGSGTDAGIDIYHNNTVVDTTDRASGVYDGMTNTNTPFRIGSRKNGGVTNLPFDGIIDEVKVYDNELTPTEVGNLFNYGQTTVPTTAKTWGLYVNDLYNDTDLSGVTVTFSAGCTNTTDTNGFAQVTNETAGCTGLSGTLSNVTIAKTNWFANQTTYTIPENSTDNAGMYQKQITVPVYEKVTNNSFTGAYNITTEGGKTYANGTDIYAKLGVSNYTFSAAGWYNKTATFNVSQIGIPTSGYKIYGVTNSKVTVNSQDVNGNPITTTTNMSVNYSTFTENCTTTNGTCFFYLTQGLNYTFISNPINYTIANKTVLINASEQEVNITHYTERTFNILIKDEITNTVINDTTFTIEIINSIEANNYTTSNGTLLLTLLTPEDYTIRYQSAQHPLRNYYETIAQESYFNITLYALTSGNATDTLVIVEDTTGDDVQGAIVQLQRYYSDCNCYRVVEMGTTSYNGLTYLISQEATGFYKWLVEYQGSTKFLSEEPERLLANPTTGQITRTITVDLGSNYYESYTALTTLASSVTYNDATSTLSFTWNDPTSIVTRGCLKAEYINNNRWVTNSQNCADGTTGNVLLTLNNTNTTTYKWAAYVDTSSTYSTHTLDTGWLTPGGSNTFGKVAAFSSLFIIIGGAALFSFSAVALTIWIAIALIAFITIQIAGLITILPFTLQFITGLTAIIIGLSLYLMRR